jgi:hypothetical protein
MARADYVEKARGFVEVIDALAEFIGLDRSVVDTKIAQAGGTSTTFLKSLRHRKSMPPKTIDAGAYFAICRILNELALTAARQAEAHVAEAETIGCGVDPGVYRIVCELSARAKALIGEDEVARIKGKIAAEPAGERQGALS